MKCFSLVFRIFKSNKILSALLCFEIALMLIVSLIAVNTVDRFNKLLTVSENADLQSSIYFSGRAAIHKTKIVDGRERPYLSRDESYKKEMLDYLSEQPGYLGRSSNTSMTIPVGNEVLHINSFDEITSKKLKCRTQKGNWHSHITMLDNGRIPCVIVDTNVIPNKYKIGDIISGSPTTHLTDPDDVTQKKAIPSDLHLEFQVVGIVNRMESIILNAGNTFSSGENMDLSLIFENMKPNSTTMLCGEIPQLPKNDSIHGLLYFDDDLSAQEVETINTKLNSFGSSYKISQMYDATKKIVNNKIRMNIPQILVLFSIALVGLISITLLNSKKQMKIFSIYNLCGSTRKKCILIYFFYLLTLLMISFLLTIAFMQINYLTNNQGIFYLFYLFPEAVSVCLIMCLLISVISTLIPFLSAQNKSIINNYKCD